MIYLYGMQMEVQSAISVALAAAGRLLAALTAWSVNRRLRLTDYRHFFNVSGFLLLLFVTGAERIIGIGLMLPVIDSLWDNSMLINDASRSGAMLSSFTGYRARPSLMLVVITVGYSISVTLMGRRQSRNA